MAKQEGASVANEAGKKSFSFNMEARKQMDQNSRPEGGDGAWFVSPSKQTQGTPVFYRLIPWPTEVIAHFGIGNFPYMTVNKYGFRHPCKKQSNDATKAVWFSHVSEASYKLGAEDTFFNHLKDRWEESEEYKAKIVATFRSDFGAPKAPSDCVRGEFWILVQQMETNLDEVKGADGKTVLWSVPVGTPKIMQAPWKVIERLFGSTKMPLGIFQEVGDDLLNPDDGVDFSVTYNGKGVAATTSARRKNSTVDSETYFLDEHQPPVLDLIQKGIKSDEACRLIDIFLGLEACGEDDYGDDAPEEEKEEVADTARTRTRGAVEEKAATTTTPPPATTERPKRRIN